MLALAAVRDGAELRGGGTVARYGSAEPASPPRSADCVPFRDRIEGLLAFDGAAGKTPFVAAVETTHDRQPRRLRLQVVKGFRKAEITKLAQSSFAAGSNVVSDGLRCWQAVGKAGCDHFPMSTGSGKKAAQWPSFNWVNTTLGNIKTALAGTYHHVSPKHAQRYLASFAWRCNRRYQLDTLPERLIWAALQAEPRPYRVIVAG